MGHVKQKKSTSSSTSTPPETPGNEVMLTTKENVPHSTRREKPQQLHSRRSYPEQLNVEELISQINYRNTSNEVTNDNNNTILRTSNQLCDGSNPDLEKDVERGPSRRHHRQRPLYRRLITFIRNLWIGAKFNVGKDGKQSRKLL